MTAIQRSLLRQAALRLWLAFLATLLVVGGAGAAFYFAAQQRSTDAQASSLTEFYRGRLKQLDGRWEVQALQLKNQLELARILERPGDVQAAAESFLTMIGEESGFQNVHIDDAEDRLLFTRHATLAAPPAHTTVEGPPRWYFDAATRVLHRVYSLPIWLGQTRGMGHLHWYVPIDNGLLFDMAIPGSELDVLWHGEVVASSAGSLARGDAVAFAGQMAQAEDMRVLIRRRVAWGDAAAPPLLAISHWPARPLSPAELWLATLATLVAMVLALAGALGIWLWRTGRRMALLGEASRQFSLAPTQLPAVTHALALAGAESGDEIREVATALGHLIQGVVDRERERDEKEAALLLAEHSLTEALELAGLAYWALDLASMRIRMNDQFLRVYRSSAAAVGGYELTVADYVERFLFPEDAPQVERNLAQVLAEADPAITYQDEARVCCGDGLVRWIAVRYHVELDAAGAPVRLSGTIQDIDERKRQELELRRYRDILDAARDIISSADPDGRVFYLNAAGRKLLGISPDDTNLGAIPDYHPPQIADHIRENALPLCNAQGYWEGETVLRSRQSHDFPVWQVIVAHKSRGGRVQHYSTIARDLTERKRAEDELRLMATVFESSGEAILITDSSNRIVTANAAFTQLTGYALEEVRGKNPKLLSAGRTTGEEYAAMWRAIVENGFWRGEIWDRRKDGSVYPKWLSITAVRNGRGWIVNYLASFADITEHKRAEERIKHLAHHDALTGLPNRFSLQSRLAQAVAGAQRKGEKVAVMFIDLDRFKTINDTLGHHIGDELLIAVAARLQQCVRHSDIVARLGGDEFVVALPGTDSTGDVVGVAEKILASLALPHVIDGHELHATPSVGISLYPDDGADEDALMKNADIAMYHAKSLGRNNYQFFAAAMNQAAVERLTLESQLRQAVERQEFLLHYQPQIDLDSGRVVGVEALLRWQHPEAGLVAPDRFIPILEDTGLIVAVGEWVLRAACRELKRWQEEGLNDVQVAVNLSARQFRQKNLAAMVYAVLHEFGVAAGQLELEITESVAMGNPQETIAALRELKRMGVMLAIDDFGTGYSSLSYLKLFPINRLKLDRSFVADIESDPNDAAICAATIGLAHNLGLDVVAEGVETQAQADYLRRLDCDIAQGYFYARPQPGAAAAQWIAARNGPPPAQ